MERLKQIQAALSLGTPRRRGTWPNSASAAALEGGLLVCNRVCAPRHSVCAQRPKPARPPAPEPQSPQPPAYRVEPSAAQGEVAIRICRAAAELGIRTVAVYSEDDAQSLHTKKADVAVALTGAGFGAAAYLNQDAMLEVAREYGCSAVHCGYGFLSENAEFVASVEAAGLTFVGPPSAAIELFGDKTKARELAQSAGVPLLPGTTQAVSLEEARQFFASLGGEPMMIKALAGGGGRGMRPVFREDELEEAFERCQSEALGAFGNGAVFVEKLMVKPRHIEVQVLADGQGGVTHLYERECSVQRQNQKVVEIAPSPSLPPSLRERLLADAIKLVSAANYRSAATVEFLVDKEMAEDSTYAFMEVNPRLQVEHTITEEICDVDIVQTQLHIAAGATLDSLGLAEVGGPQPPRGFAIQCRVNLETMQADGTSVPTGGVLTQYEEPGGRGVRVDSFGYAGYETSGNFDSLLAKLICYSSATDYASAVSKTRHSLLEFKISGVETNIPFMLNMLSLPSFQQNEIHTSYIADNIDALLTPVTDEELHFDTPAPTATGPGGISGGSESMLAPLEVGPGQEAIECPVGGLVVELRVQVGDQVNIGDALIVVSAMKTETLVESNVAGVCVAVQDVDPGAKIGSGDMITVIDTIAQGSGKWESGADLPEGETWDFIMKDIELRHSIAIDRLNDPADPGVARQKSRGKLTCRERISLLLDKGSFREIGSVAGFATMNEYGDLLDFHAASHVGGKGKIEGRDMVCCADDFTSRGGHADGSVGAKSVYFDRLATHHQIPMIRLLDGSSGGGSPPKVDDRSPNARTPGGTVSEEQDEVARLTAELAEATRVAEERLEQETGRKKLPSGGGMPMPQHQGGDSFATQLATVPVVTMLLGSVVGIGAAKAMVTHFCVMVKDISQLFVAGPPVVKVTMNYDITKEDLGNWEIHCRNGSVDNLAESEEDAVYQTRRFLSYLPSNCYEVAPIHPSNPNDPPTRRDEELNTLIPRNRTQTFDVRRGIEIMADKGSFFEIGGYWGTDQVTGFVRFDGYPVGIVASDSRHINGGALTADGCDKLCRFIDLCDVFHIPIVNLCDNPGFAVGLEHELRGTIRKGAQWMVAWSQAKMPVFTVIMRRSFGVGAKNATF
jgi:acetyl/propionyl-CoA carboxylase alpha subunit/acetyl-CoA carboxylase carboxyltransferase component